MYFPIYFPQVKIDELSDKDASQLFYNYRDEKDYYEHTQILFKKVYAYIRNLYRRTAPGYIQLTTSSLTSD